MFDDDERVKPKKEGFLAPANIEKMSVDELRAYITELEAEIKRCEADIKDKQASRDAAASFFKS